MLRSTDASPSQEVPSRSPAICSCRKHPAPLPLLRRERLHRRGRRCSFLVRRCSRGRGRADNPDPRRLPNEVLPPSAAADQPFFERKCFSQTAETGPRPGRSRAQVPHREPARLGFVNPGAPDRRRPPPLLMLILTRTTFSYFPHTPHGGAGPLWRPRAPERPHVPPPGRGRPPAGLCPSTVRPAPPPHLPALGL